MFDSVALVIGEDRYPLFMKEKILKEKIEPFAAAFNGDRWTERIERTIYLPEDDVHAWKNAVDFIMTGDFEPRLAPCCDCPVECIDGEGVKMHDAANKHSVFDPPIQVWDRFGNVHDFGCGDKTLGHWRVSRATAELFNTLVDTFSLAEKYLWLELQEACLNRLRVFPIGPEAFTAIATMAEYRDEKHRWDRYGPKTQFNEWVQKACNYHAIVYDEMEVRRDEFTEPYFGGEPKLYKCHDNFMRQNMTEEAWRIFTQMRLSRADEVRSKRKFMGVNYWSCEDKFLGECQGMCIIDWNEFKAVDTEKLRERWKPHRCITSSTDTKIDKVNYTAASGPATPLDSKSDRTDPTNKDIALAAHMDPEELRWYGAKFSELIRKYAFAGAEPGDWLVNIKATEDPRPGYLATVLRTGETGWFPCDGIRLLEHISKNYCTSGPCCPKPSNPTQVSDDTCEIEPTQVAEDDTCKIEYESSAPGADQKW